ncbi:MAG: NAD(P)-dependent oxidoreductase [Bacteroidetes bacterium RIFCSPLOWO2_12_FULL_35_15]|nr:MAG: NAD(P)-dependent oxidoreductase [Bacteroidetes bacterium RIFCSPLOWO2_12_FULL_35_15]
MKKILITGSNGLLGQKLVYALIKRKDVQVIATSLGANRLLKQEGYIYESLDITNRSEVETVIKKYQPDVIINTAAMTNVDACETKREECWALNVTAVQNFVDALQNPSPSERGRGEVKTLFIHLSTDFIFDGKKGSEYVETDKPDPQSYYARSKYESEKVLEKSMIKWAIARTIIVYGIVDNMSRSNIVLWAKDALTKGQKINVVDDQFRAPTLAEDLADGCILIADKNATGIFHLSGKETMSILELVYKVADYWHLDKTLITPSKSNTLNQPAKRPPRTGFDISKAKRELGYEPHSFVEGLEILDKQLKEV